MLHDTPLPISVTSSVTQPGDFLELALLNAWLDAADAGLLVLDSDNQVVMINASASALLSLEAAQMIGQPIKRALVNVERWPQVMEWLNHASANAQLQVVVQPLEQAPGQTFKHALLKLSRIVLHGQVWRVLALSDVSALVNAQQSVEANRRQWQALNAGVVIADATQPDLPIVFVNATFEAMSGYSMKETLGRNCRFLQGDDTDQPGLQMLRKAMITKTNGYAVLRNYRKDGSLFYNELFISPVRNEAGMVTHFVGIQHMRDERYRDEPGLLGEQAVAKFSAY